MIGLGLPLAGGWRLPQLAACLARVYSLQPALDKSPGAQVEEYAR